MKYGLLMIVAAIPAFTMVVIVAWVFGEMMSSVFEGGDIEGGLIFGAIGAIVMVVALMTASIQVITFALNSAFKDAMPTYKPMGYIETWTRAFTIFLELIYLIGIIVVLFILAALIMKSSFELAGLMWLVGGIMFWLTYMGLIPYVCRRVLEEDANAQKGDGNNKDPLGGLYPPS
jgi:hypothetical protein